MRYERQRLIKGYEHLDEFLSGVQLSIAGCGGIGGLCSYLLAGAGVLHLKLADGDVVEDSNLHRQILYGTGDIGKRKVECAKRCLEELNPGIRVQCFGRIDEHNFGDFAGGSTLVLDLTDNVETRLLLNRMCVKYRKDFIHGSVAASRGMLCAYRFSSPEFIRRCGCYECMAGADAKPAFAGITGPWANGMACMAASLAMRLLSGEDYDGQVHLFDLKTFRNTAFTLQRDPQCRCCAVAAAAAGGAAAAAGGAEGAGKS